MKRRSAVLALSVGMVNLASAEPRATYRWTDPSLQGSPWSAPAVNGASHVIFLNNCKPNGCTLHAGFDNSSTDTSSIPNGTSLVQPYSGSDATWSSIVSCVRQT